MLARELSKHEFYDGKNREYDHQESENGARLNVGLMRKFNTPSVRAWAENIHKLMPVMKYLDAVCNVQDISIPYSSHETREEECPDSNYALSSDEKLKKKHNLKYSFQSNVLTDFDGGPAKMTLDLNDESRLLTISADSISSHIESSDLENHLLDIANSALEALKL